eukprot:CAMPEP_0113630666 /NCGR_PEP_ID=MMETSP0017_2-20120614/15935_1 /TAXON_ID=2856 /ORGANISM="Cylindrotheca closterium" /LENGTH=241 /DNA_ID=CAMNT_0000541143 /DNA_START=10 /DNA_END=735 /DNA_ORIENTATION=+ /assembly_acc=CAM_ASM_000147
MRILQQGLRYQSRFGSNAVLKNAIFNASKAPHICVSSVTEKLNQTPMRMLSTASASNLLASLRREYEEEVQSGQNEVPEDLLALKNNLEEDWRIVEEGATTTLYSKSSQKIQVSFHCQDSVEEIDSNEDQYDNEDEEASPVHFQVTLSKAGKSLILECLSDYGEARVVGVQTETEEMEESQQYQGPDFVELDEGLQESFSMFLKEELAVDDDVASFIAMQSDYTEQTQYVRFLKDAQSIIE